ncbi:MAG: O-antigen ligase family protein, partial [Chloroflexota bacterium]|nr:O-antigen ligase family protein [Chloroflexota bacterium]
LQAFDLPKSLLSRALAFLLAGLLALALLRFGLSIIPRTRLHIAVALFLAANVVAALFAENKYLALFGENERYLGLTFLADMLVLYVAVAVGIKERSDFVVCFGAIGIATLVVVPYAAVQDVGADPLKWLRYEGDRPFSTLGLSDQLGHFLSITFGMALGVAAFSEGLRRTAVRWVAGASVLLVASASAVVATRGSLIGIGAAVLAAFFVRLRVDAARSERRLAGILAISAAALALVLLLATSPLAARTARTVDDLGSGRLGVYRVVVMAFLDRPITGYGPDSVGTVYNRYQDTVSDRLGSPQTSAHDWALQTLVTTGVVGLAAQLVLLASFAFALFARALPRMPAVAAPLALASVAYWVNGLVDVGSISVDWFPWFAFGAIASLTGRRPVVEAPRVLPTMVVGLIALASLAAAASPLTAFLANRSAQTARSALAANDAASAVEAASRASRTDPGRADYWNWLGLSLEGIGTTADASDAYAEAARRAPYEATYWANLALVRAREATTGGDPSARSSALDAARRCVEADPMSWQAHEVLAKVAFQLGEYQLALDGAVAAFRMASVHDDPETIAIKSANALASRSALDQLDQAIAFRETAALQLTAAVISERLGDRAGAVAHARRVLALEPENEEARLIVRTLGP